MADDQLEFWYDLASTYSYLAAERVEQVAASRGLQVSWRPFLLGPIFHKQLGINDSPFNHNPVRGRYMWRDLERLCAAAKLPFRKPSVFPRGSTLGARVALIGADAGWAGPFTRAVFRANFGEDREIGDGAVLASILDGLGLPGRALCEQAVSAAEKPRLRRQTDAAEALGIFGAPSFVRRGELFFGNERLEQAADWTG
jgi:2-hydroxychromene-2-carboxylate isomerase